MRICNPVCSRCTGDKHVRIPTITTRQVSKWRTEWEPVLHPMDRLKLAT